MSMHLRAPCMRVRAMRQGEETQAPRSPAAIKAESHRGGGDLARPVGIQAVRESDETL